MAVWRRHVALPILGTFVVPLAVCLAGFALLHPVFGYVTLNFVWLLLPYTLLLAAGIQLLPRRAGMAAAGLLLIGNLWGLRNAYAEASAPLAQAAISWLDVFVTGLGEENCRPDDMECLKRQKTNAN